MGNSAGRFQVLTTFVPLYCFAARVAGSAADVENLLPANVSPHDYQFSRRDLRKLEKADVLVLNGGGLDSWLNPLLEGTRATTIVIKAIDGTDSELIRQPPSLEGFSTPSSVKGQPNPHIWLDPLLAQAIVTNILHALQKADPTHSAEYATNAKAYVSVLDKLNQDFQKTLAPFRGVPMVTLHDAFPYLARRYGLRLAGVLEQVPDVDPSAKYLRAFQQLIRREQIEVFFLETQAASRLALQLSSDLHLRVARLDTIETGALRKETYELAMRQNLKTLSESLSLSHAPKPEAKR